MVGHRRPSSKHVVSALSGHWAGAALPGPAGPGTGGITEHRGREGEPRPATQLPLR